MKQKYYEVYHFLLEIFNQNSTSDIESTLLFRAFLKSIFFQLIDHGFGRIPENTWENKIFLVNLRNSIQTQPVPNFFGTQTQLNPTQTHHYADQCRCLHLIGLQIDKKCFSTVFFLKKSSTIFLSIRKMVHI